MAGPDLQAPSFMPGRGGRGSTRDRARVPRESPLFPPHTHSLSHTHTYALTLSLSRSVSPGGGGWGRAGNRARVPRESPRAHRLPGIPLPSQLRTYYLFRRPWNLALTILCVQCSLDRSRGFACLENVLAHIAYQVSRFRVNLEHLSPETLTKNSTLNTQPYTLNTQRSPLTLTTQRPIMAPEPTTPPPKIRPHYALNTKHQTLNTKH